MKYDKCYFTDTSVKGKDVYEIYLKYIDELKIPVKGKLICDVGCATGEFIKSVIKENNCYGFDISSYAIDQCKKKLPNIKKQLFCLDLNKEAFNKKLEFDIITMFDIIEHLDNFTFLKELFNRNLKKGGHVIITTPNSNSILRYISQTNFTGEMDSTHVMLFTPYTLDFFLRKCGLKKVHISTPYSFYFKKNFITEHILLGGQIFAVYEKL